jgi:hypothetical protein
MMVMMLPADIHIVSLRASKARFGAPKLTAKTECPKFYFPTTPLCI